MGGPDVRTVDVVIDLPFYLLQTLRLAQAIGDAGFRICVEPIDRKAVITLKKTFGFDYKIGTAGTQKIAGLYVDHMTPLTRIGSIERQLIMPRAILTHCRERWPRERRFDVSFAGLLTETRRGAINDWLHLSNLEQIALPAELALLGKLLRKISRRLWFPIEDHVGTRNVKIYASDRGRHFPLKSWNASTT